MGIAIESGNAADSNLVAEVGEAEAVTKVGIQPLYCSLS